MELVGTEALVTGANRGLGKALVKALVKAGVARIHASARARFQLPNHGPQTHGPKTTVLPLDLDITNPEQVAQAAAKASGTRLLINNAGLLPRGGAMTVSEEDMQAAMDVNLMGTWRMIRAFAPVIEANGGGVIVNILSLISLQNTAPFAAYSAAKHASWDMTQSFMQDLAHARVQVIPCFPGGIDTDMLKGVPAMKASPDGVAEAVISAIKRGDAEIFPDDQSATHGPALRRTH